MRGLSDAELDLRFADVVTNQSILTAEGKIGIVGTLWHEKFAHIQAELQIRGRTLPAPQSLGDRLRVPNATPSALGARVRRWISSSSPLGPTLFKYGRSNHLGALHHDGILLLRPASYYRDPSLNPAVADDELSFEKIRGRVRTRYVQKGDYYCFCSACLHSDRLIQDFPTTAVLAITDPHQFFLRLAAALDRLEYEILFNKVTYVDPLLLDDHEIADLRFIKHMRFSYQMEHRWVATPPMSSQALSELTVTMGSLRDISVLHGA
jgi:hypothetical protein